MMLKSKRDLDTLFMQQQTFQQWVLKCYGIRKQDKVEFMQLFMKPIFSFKASEDCSIFQRTQLLNLLHLAKLRRFPKEFVIDSKAIRNFIEEFVFYNDVTSNKIVNSYYENTLFESVCMFVRRYKQVAHSLVFMIFDRLLFN